MKCSLSSGDLKDYVLHQTQNFFPDNRSCRNEHFFLSGFDMAMERTEKCFSHIAVKGYSKNGIAYFNHLHMDQYGTFLYFLSNSIYKILGENNWMSDKLILLNRALLGCWFSYKGELPDIFCLDHPVGTVLGNATYSNYLVVSQNVTVQTGEGKIGEYVALFSGATLLEDCYIGDEVSIGARVVLRKTTVPQGHIVFCKDGINHIQQSKQCSAKRFFTLPKDEKSVAL